jgi:hypothetical protein
MIPATALAFAQALEAAAMKQTGFRVKGIDYKPDENGNMRVVKKDTRPTHVRQKHRRTKGKVTGARAAK